MTGRPDSNTNRVARSNNSTGYFLALGMTSGFSFHQGNPGIEASVKPGRAQLGALAVFALDAQSLARTLARQAEEILSSLVGLDEARMSQERTVQP